MKNLKYVIVCAVMLLFSCSTEETFYQEGIDTTNPFLEGSSSLPGNDKNPYDRVGKHYREALEQYLKTGNHAYREQLEKEINENFMGNNNLVERRAVYHGNKMSLVTDDPQQILQDIIANSGLTLIAQTSLLDFIDIILTIQDDGYGVLYNYIIGYESIVIDHTSLTERDKQVILTFSSLVRQAFYSYSMENMTTGDEPDDDWNNTIGNIIGYLEIALAENP